MKTLFKILVCVYLCLSLMWTIVYNTSEDAWNVASARNGLLVWGYDDAGWWILSPFTNYADNFLIGITVEDGHMRVFSDGLDNFGVYNLPAVPVLGE